MTAPTPFRAAALAAALRPRPLGGRRLAELLCGADGPGAFRGLVRLVLPGEEAAIMETGGAGAGRDREAARVDAFVTRFSARHFPLYEQDEYAGLLGHIPFVPFGWSSDEFHDITGLHTGHLLMLALSEDVYEGYRGALLDHLTTLGLPAVLLAPLAGGGLPREELRRRLTGGPFAAVCTFADWAHGTTGLFFLDCCAEYEIDDTPWCREAIDNLTADWRLTVAALDQIDAVRTLLEAAPARAFADLLRAVGLPAPDDPAGFLDDAGDVARITGTQATAPTDRPGSATSSTDHRGGAPIAP